MPSAYLTGQDLEIYGVADATPGQIIQASGLLDSYLKRPEGMVWSPGADGLPAYMAAATPSLALTLPAPVVPGHNVVVPLPVFGTDLTGEVLILDRTNNAACEAVTVTGTDTVAGTITLAQVKYPHAANATVEAGLLIAEERPLPARRSLARVSRPQIIRILGAAGRYGYGRRSDAHRGYGDDFALLAMAQTFGGPPIWESLDVTQTSVSAQTGEVWIPSGFLMAYFSDVRLRYVAGFSAAAIPPAIKQATALLVSSVASGQQEMSTSFKVLQAGGSRIERFNESNFDADTKAMLEPYRTRVMA